MVSELVSAASGADCSILPEQGRDGRVIFSLRIQLQAHPIFSVCSPWSTSIFEAAKENTEKVGTEKAPACQ